MNASASLDRAGVPPLSDVEAMLAHGDLLQAGMAISALLDADPAEPRAWLLQARLLAAKGSQEAAKEACRRAIALWPDILPAYRLLSELAADNGKNGLSGDEAQALALARRTLFAADPTDASLANRIGQDLVAGGRFAEALAYLRLSAPVLGHADLALWNYTSSLARTGSYHELLSIEPMLQEFAAGSLDPFGPFVHLAAAKLALDGHDARTRQALADRCHSAAWLDATSLAERLQAAIAGRTPFSVVMLSDSDARLFVYGSLKAHLQLSQAELSSVINSVWTGAFGGTIEAHGAFAAGRLVRLLQAGIDSADVAGLPEATHLADAHEHSGFLVQMLERALQRASPYCTGLSVMSSMHDGMPFLRPLLAELPFLGFVGSYPDLANRLSRFCQIEQTTTYRVPGAMNRQDIPQALRGDGHFPERFEQVMAQLDVPYPGAVFLVAAGMLGPAYCGRIKQLGGIAIDVDTLVTRWVRG